MNSILQMMGKRAPNMNVTLASDRMQLKKGTPISPDDCTSLHDQVIATMSSGPYLQRHLPAIPSRSPAEREHVPCQHQLRDVSMIAVRFAHALYPHRVLLASTVWSAKQCFTSAFVMCWSYYSGLWVAMGSCADSTFQLEMPLNIVNLAKVLSSDHRLQKTGVRSLRMYHTSLTWSTLLTAHFGTPSKHIDLKPSYGKKPPKPQKPTSTSAGGLAAAVASSSIADVQADPPEDCFVFVS